MRFKFWIETRKIERDIAKNPTFLVFTCSMYKIRVSAISIA